MYRIASRICKRPLIACDFDSHHLLNRCGLFTAAFVVSTKRNHPGLKLFESGVMMMNNSAVHNRLATFSTSPFSPEALSPRTILSFPDEAIFSSTSSSRSRIRTGLSDSSLAVLT